MTQLERLKLVCEGLDTVVTLELNDCWPVMSWSAVDGSDSKKLLRYATRKFYADRLLTFQPEGAQLFLYFHNDADEVWQGDAEVYRQTFGARG